VQLDDAAVASGVKSRLAQVNAGSVEVSARNGVVVLQGSLPDTGTKNRVVELVRQSEGVVQVVDRLVVGGTRRK
jgi:osmotically-inducible protein OsmY